MIDNKERFTKSQLKQTPEQKKKNKKLRDTQIRAGRKKAGEKKPNCDDNIEQEKGKIKDDDKDREKNGQFKSTQTLSVGNGRPPIFSDSDKLSQKIDEYIDDCPDVKLCYTSDGAEYKKKIPTISGLAYYLGFESRQSMYDYKNKDNAFSYIIKRAMLYMEKHYEQIMQGKAPTGAIFALKNQGWKDKTEVDNTHKFTGQAPITFGDTSKAKK